MSDFQIPILMYHEITTEQKLKQILTKTQHSFVLKVEQFEIQMRWLAESGFSTISLYDIVNLIQNGNSVVLPPKPVVLTFDDGFEGNHEYALPILKKYGFSAVFFVIIDFIGSTDWMNWNQLKELVSSGMSVQSHTMSHYLLGQMDRNRIEFELKTSRQQLEDKLQTPVNFVSLPFGSYNKLYEDIARQAGYLGGCTSEIGFIHPQSEPFFLNRIDVKSQYDLEEFKKIAECSPGLIQKISRKKKYKNLIKLTVGEKFYNKLYCHVYGIQQEF